MFSYILGVKWGHALDLFWKVFRAKLPKLAQDGPRWPKMAQDGRKMVPRWSQDGPTMVQDGLRWSRNGPKMAQDGSRRSQDGPKMAQGSSKWSQDGPKMVQDGPEGLEVGIPGKGSFVFSFVVGSLFGKWPTTKSLDFLEVWESKPFSGICANCAHPGCTSFP